LPSFSSLRGMRSKILILAAAHLALIFFFAVLFPLPPETSVSYPLRQGTANLNEGIQYQSLKAVDKLSVQTQSVKESANVTPTRASSSLSTPQALHLDRRMAADSPESRPNALKNRRRPRFAPPFAPLPLPPATPTTTRANRQQQIQVKLTQRTRPTRRHRRKISARSPVPPCLGLLEAKQQAEQDARRHELPSCKRTPRQATAQENRSPGHSCFRKSSPRESARSTLGNGRESKPLKMDTRPIQKW